MVAIAVTSPGVLEVSQQSAPIPPGPGEVLLRVERAGICGSDLHIFHGSNPFARYPRVIGHEFAGHIVDAGDGVSGLAPGDRVVVDPVLACVRRAVDRRPRARAGERPPGAGDSSRFHADSPGSRPPLPH